MVVCAAGMNMDRAPKPVGLVQGIRQEFVNVQAQKDMGIDV